MLNRIQLKRYRELRGLSTRKVAEYCDISQPMITQIETGAKHLNQHCHDEIIKGINDATRAIQLEKRKKKSEAIVENAVATEGAPIEDESPKEEIKIEKKTTATKKRTTKVADTKKSKTPKATKAKA